MSDLKLGEMAKLIRSKNAGPFNLTIDILFNNKKDYEAVIRSQALSSKRIADLYGLNEDKIQVYQCDMVQAIKISFNRLVSAGGLGDHDVFGGQQHGPLVEMEV